MSLYENIKFSNDLIENEACNITYSGYLFEKNSTCVSIVYGFGPEWKHTTEQKMEKTDEGFVATVNIREFESFNFCFKNLDNEWDNNYNNNYTSPISRPVINEAQELQESTPEYDFILNNNEIIEDIIDNILEIDLSNPIYNEPLHLDTEFSQISKIEDESFEIEVEINRPVNIEETLVASTESEILNQDLENMFNEIYEAPVQEIESAGEFDMDNLIDEILSPIVKSSVFDENVKDSLENYEHSQNTSVNFFDDFEDFEDDLSVDNKIDSLIADLFNNTKEARQKAEVENIEIKESVPVNNEPLFVENIETEAPTLEVEQIQETVVENIEISKDLEKSIDNRIEELLSTGPITEIIEETNVENIETQQESNEVQEVVELFEEAEVEEESLIETINEEQESNELSLMELPDENGFVVSPRALSKFYMFRKKVKLAFTKLFIAIPRYLSRGFDNENN